jgi:YHS domain-containing protein
MHEYGEPMKKDPVCGMSVDETIAKDRLNHEGDEYAFCGSFCREEFQREPRTYLDPGYRPSTAKLFGKFVADRVRSLFGG